MKVGILAPLRSPQATPDFVHELARGAEAAGASSIWQGEHVVLFPRSARENGSPRVGTPDGTFSLPQGSGLVDVIVLLSYLAALTSRVRLGTGVRILPQANPVYVAKEIASLDWLSNGRIDFGIGVGSNPAEFAVCGAPYVQRGARTDEYVALIRTLWRDDPARFDGRFWSLPECSLDPKPRQPGGPPIFIGGHSPAALARVARLGDGWFDIGRSVAATRELLARLDRLLAQEGRERSEVRIVLGGVGDPGHPSSLDPYEEAGVDEVLVVLGRQDRNGLARALDAVHALSTRS